MEKAYFIKKEFHLKEKMKLFKCIDEKEVVPVYRRAQ